MRMVRRDGLDRRRKSGPHFHSAWSRNSHHHDSYLSTLSLSLSVRPPTAHDRDEEDEYSGSSSRLKGKNWFRKL